MRIAERLGWTIITFVLWVGIDLVLQSLPLVNGEVEEGMIALFAGLGWFGGWLIIWARK